ADDPERGERADPRRQPRMQRDEADHHRAERRERGHPGEGAGQRREADLAADFALRPVDLPIDVGPHGPEQRGEHQPRPRDIIPSTMPTTKVPAIVRIGLRRAMASSSDAKVLTCSLAALARSAPLSAAPLAASPTCEATDWWMLRTAFAASPP